VEVLARAALILLYCEGKPSLAFFLFGAGSRGDSKTLADVPAPFPFVCPIFVQLSNPDPFPDPDPLPALIPDPRTDPEPGPSPELDPFPGPVPVVSYSI
jgi:hypothetical protein